MVPTFEKCSRDRLPDFSVFVVFVEYFPKKRIPDFSWTFPVFFAFVEYFPKRRMTDFSLIFT